MSSEHKKHDKKYDKLKFSIVIVSDSRFRQFKNRKKIDDLTIPLVKKLMNQNNQILISENIVPDKSDLIEKKINELITEIKPDIIITSGGTGINPRDITIETMLKLYDKELVGFGELFRRLSFNEIGAITILSRANAGIYKNTLIFNLPGNPKAVELALKEIIFPVASHSIAMLR